MFDASIAAHYGVTPDALVAFKNFDDKKSVYTGSTKTKDVEDWIKQNSSPLVVRLNIDGKDCFRCNLLASDSFLLSEKPDCCWVVSLSRVFVYLQGEITSDNAELYSKRELPIGTLETFSTFVLSESRCLYRCR
mgnify:CR=1 FL=1